YGCLLLASPRIQVRYPAMKTIKWIGTTFCLIFALTLTPLPQEALAPQPESDALPFTLKPLGHNAYAAIGGPKAGANAGFVIGDDGVLVVDTFESADAAKALLSEIRKLTPLPVKYVVNTHCHLDHTGGNRVFQDASAAVIAHRNVPSW